MRPSQDVEALRRAAVAAGWLVAAVGAWAMLARLAGRIPAPLSPLIGAGLLAGGLALPLLVAAGGPARRWVGRALGVVATGAGAAALVGLGAPSHQRPSVAAAIALLLAGAALATLDLGRGPVGPADVLAPSAVLIALAAALERLHAVVGLSSVAPLAAMPTTEAVVLGVLAGATLLARPARGLGRLVTLPGSGGLVSRRLAPLVLLPFVTAAASAFVLAFTANAAVVVTVNTALAVVVAYVVLVRAVRELNRLDARRSRRLAALRDERDHSDTLLRSMAESVVVLDPDLRVIEANQQWCELIGRSRGEVIGKDPPYPWQPAGETAGRTPDSLTPNPPYPRLAGPANDEYVQRPDGTLVPVLATRAAVPGPDGRPRAYVATFTDITAQKRAGDVLAEQAALLERVNQHLRRTNERLEHAAGFSSDLTALLSHEVAQPLTSIASLAELLAEGWDQLPDSTRFEVTIKIDRNARRLVGLIRDMLLLFRLDSGTVTSRRTPVLIADAVDSVLAAQSSATQSSAPQSSAEVATDAVAPTMAALADRSHLELVLAKLVGNAVAYGRPPIEVSCEERAEGVVIVVSDQGEGIPEDLRRRLFDRTVPPSTAAQGSAKGPGLGLFIARQLVEANGGAIWYEPGTPSGARLLVRLESASAHVQAATHESVSPRQ